MSSGNNSRREVFKSTVMGLAAAFAAAIVPAATGKSARQNTKQTNPSKQGAKKGAPSIGKLSSVVSVNENIDSNFSPELEAFRAQAENCKRPLPGQNSEEWDEVQKRALSAMMSQVTSSIEKLFTFAPKHEDDAFRFQHLEILLDQTADLLERGLSLREQYNDLSAKAFEVAMDIQQFFDLDKIHKDETAAGYYCHDAEEAAGLTDAEKKTCTGLDTVVKSLADIKRTYYSENNTKQVSIDSQAQPYFSFVGFDEPIYWPGAGGKVVGRDVVPAAAGRLSVNQQSLQNDTLGSQIIGTQSSRGASSSKSEGYEARYRWEKANVEFRRRRTEVALGLAQLKAREYTRPNGAINYDARKSGLKERFDRDFRDALARVNVTAQGLQSIYGYDVPLPPSVLALINGRKPNDEPIAFDDCLIWVRDAISFLVRFGNVDQEYSLPISIANVLKKEGKNLKEVSSGKLEFSIDPTYFPDQYYVRLRGVSVYVVPNPSFFQPLGSQLSKGVWLARITPPTASYIEHFPKEDGSANKIILDQKDIPPSIAGRVSYREDIRQPDVVGGSSLFNVSPFGLWQLSLTPASTQGDLTSQLKDVVLELHVAVRMKR